ncbi:MAG TPA: FAD/NAD(P)-binding protein [Flavobacteriaceae bacterium]|nr:FAD/NAD(P)-binding protein [Flavobacteriaceae bacterium]
MNKSLNLLPKLPIKTVGIIGAGPRGLSALESLYLQYAKQNPPYLLKVIVFEATGNFGNGQVYTKKQLSSNLLNLSDRALTINCRPEINTKKITLSAFPSYHQWSNFKENNNLPDTYASRAVIGNYLSERFNSIYNNLKSHKLITKQTTTIENIDYKNNTFYLYNNKNCYEVDEVLLTIGHQQIELDKQLKEWSSCTDLNKNLKLVAKPYPIANYLNFTKNKDLKIALRGFGLAMIDIAKAIALANGCKFIREDETSQKLSITNQQGCPKLIPFSLDGLPMAPKPLNAKIDSWFSPSKKDLENFEHQLKAAVTDALHIKSNSFLTKALAPVIASTFLNLKNKAVKHSLNKEEIVLLVENWIENKEQENVVFTDVNLDAYALMKHYAQMATGLKPITLDYCIGQVWRHLQPTIYKLLSYNNFSEKVISELIKQDEVHKRLTFGPPVESIQQLIALVEANILDLSVINNPTITCGKNGWTLKNENCEVSANMMINSVLPSPQILKVNTPLVKNLLQANYFQPIHSKLGIETLKNGLLNLPNTKNVLPIALLGRLAKGTVIGVDAILECFGVRQKYWAEDSVERLTEKGNVKE